MTSRNQPPAVNLKERIAALQQRNASPTPTSPAPSASVPNSAGLRDKIARFEKKGGVPVPRGSFGLGAPPPAENGPEKRRGELYGNRIPSSKVPTESQPGSRSASPFGTSTGRSFSQSLAEGENQQSLTVTNDSPPSSPPVSPFLGSTAEHKAGQKPTTRGTAWGTAIELAKQAENDGKILPSSRSTSPPTGQTPEPGAAAAPVSIIVSEELAQENGLGVPTILNSPTTPLVESPVANSPPPVQEAHGGENAVSATQVAEVTKSTTPTEAPQEAKPPTIPEVNIQPPAEGPSTTQNGSAAASTQALGVPNGTSASTDDLSPLASPIGPFSLANAVQDLGKVVANIQDMFPGQISPLTSPLPYKSFRAADAPQTAAPVQPQASKQPVAAAALSDAPKTAAPAVQKSTTTTSNLSTSSRSMAARPNTMFETSPTQGPQVSRGTGQPHPSTLGAKNYEHFPPTPNPTVDEFGAVPAHQKSRSTSESSNKPSTFKAKVYKKVTELPSVPAASSTASFYTAAASSSLQPEPSTALPDLPLFSPGFGELSSLLQDAALLEFTLGQEDTPSEKPKEETKQEVKEDVEPKKVEVKKEEEQPKEVEVKEQPSRNETPVPPRLETKTSSEGTNGRATPTRSKSISGPRPKQASEGSRAPEPPTIVDIPSNASQTSPKSSKGYFSSIRRLASSSKTSVNTFNHSSGHPRYSASTASEASMDDNHSVRVPPSIDVSIAEDGSKSPLMNGVSSSASSTVSKKSPMGRAASFASSMFGRKTKSSNTPANDPYAAIDRLAKNKANKSAAALVPPSIEASPATLEVPGVDPTSPQERLVSPRRHSSMYTQSTTFEPEFSTRPVSSIWGSLPSPQANTEAPAPQPANLDAIFAAKPTSPIYTTGKKSMDTETSLDAAFAADITSSVYMPSSPHPPQSQLKSKAPSTRTTGTAASSRSFLPLSPNSPSEGSEADVESPGGMSYLPSPDRPPSLLPSPNRPPSLLPSPNRPPSYMSGDEPGSGLPTPLVDSFPPVPLTAPPVPPKTPVSGVPHSATTTSGRGPRPLPSLPTRSASFFESAPLSSAVGSEFMPSATLPQRSATVRDQRR